MNNLQIFVYSGEQLRTVQRDDGLWWVLRDVCRVLNIGNVTDTKKRLDPDEVDLTDLIDSMGRVQSTTIINEPGLYAVILRSDKPEAKQLSLNLPQSSDRDLNRLMQLQGMIKDLKAECDAIKNEMMARMGDAALADTSSKRCSWVTRKKSSIDAKKLKQQFPEIYRQFEKTTEFRVFSVKNKKQEA